MRSRRLVPLAAGLNILPGAGAWLAKKIPGAGLRTAAVFAVLIITMAVIGLDAPWTAAQSDMTSFITTWRTTSANESITFPGTGSYTVDWGDGSMPTAEGGTAMHAYEDAGNYTVSVSGDLERINLGIGASDNDNDERLLSIEQWGDAEWATMNEAFRGASNMVYNAADAPDLSRVTDMNGMFRDASAFNGTISGWNVSSVTDMEDMFRDASAFNQTLVSWNVSSVTHMKDMFRGASAFNQPLVSWNVSSVTDMEDMFRDASAFNQTLVSWNVSSVTHMKDMFRGASAFNQPLVSWNVSSVTDMEDMFRGASAFNQPLVSWNVSSVTDMSGMFRDASAFNGTISAWNVSSVTDMSSMFRSAESFDQPIGSWSVSSVTEMDYMFNGASAFNQDISAWDVTGIASSEDMDDMFVAANSFDQNLGKWYVVANSTSILRSDVPGIVGEISAQNAVLRGHSPVYGKGQSDDSDHFEISENLINMTSSDTGQTSYALNVTASGGNVFGSDNTWHAFMVNVTDVAANQPPTAEAGPDQTVNEGVTVTLDGSGSSDPDNDSLTYSWASDSTPQIILTGVSPTFTAPQVDSPAVITLTLTVSDGTDSAADTMELAVSDDPLPEFVSSGLDLGTGVLRITFSEYIDVSSINASKVHLRESGNYTHGVTLTAGDLDTGADGDTISFTLTAPHLAAVAGLATPELTIEPGAVQDTTGNPIDGTFDVSTARFVYSLSVTDKESAPTGVAFSNDGAKMFVVGTSTDSVHEYALTAPFDVSNATHTANVSVSTQGGRPEGVAFSNDGAKMFIVDDVGGPNGAVREYALATPFDVTSYSFTDSLDVKDQDVTPEGVAFSNDGAKMFVVGSNRGKVNEYDLPTPFDASTAAFANVTFSVSSQETAPTGIAFSNDGAKMFVIGSSSKNVNEYDLSTPFDASTATFANVTFSVLEQESSPKDMAFSNDGAKMFVIGGSSDNVNEYDLSSVYPIAVTDTVNAPPTADAGPDLAVGEGGSVTLNGTGTDPDAGSTLTYSWTQSPPTPALVFDDANSEDPTITVPQVESPVTITLTLTVGDGTLDGTDTMELAIADTSADFVTTWKTTTADKSITIPGTGTYTVDWGDGSSPTSESGSATHEYDDADTYEVRISGGLTRINVSNLVPADAAKLQSIEQWGDIGWTSMSNAFNGATSMVYNAGDAPDLSQVTDMTYMFRDASSFNGDLSGWDVSGATTMFGMFRGASSFNGTLSGWDTTGVTSMVSIFRDATAFNQDISDWDISGVTNMADMFYGATKFDGNVSKWDTSGVADMTRLFRGAAAFNQDISGWDVSQVDIMRETFRGATVFDQDISDWVTSSVTEMYGLFRDARDFNQDISRWDTSKVTSMHSMFDSAVVFSQDISGWDVSSVTDMNGMFERAAAFNQDISGWDVSSVTDMNNMFTHANDFDQNLGEWYVVPDDTSIALSDIPGTVGTISAQNSELVAQVEAYGIGSGGDSASFAMHDGDKLNMTMAASAGPYTVNVTATGKDVFEDGNNWRMLSVTVTGASNEAPVLGAIGAKSVNELAALTFTAVATDGDSDTLAFSLTGTPPSGASINSTSGEFSWTPTEQQDGTHTITVQVEDGNGGSDSEAVTVTVSEVNQAPALNPIGPKSVNELAALTFTATASDGDIISGAADTLAFSLTGTPPSGASINSTSGAFSWTPTEQQDGTHTITVQVEDGNGGSDSEAVTVTVSEVNQAPALNPIGPKSVNELAALTFTATASDGDIISGAADTLAFSLTGTPPSGASINSTSGEFSWTPTEQQDGTHTITVQVEDGNGGSDSEAVTVTVSEVNQAPALNPIGPKSVNELAALTFTAAATDGDNDTLEFSLTGTPPSGASINSTSGEFSWTPTEQQDGTHTITVQVEDGNGGSDSEAVTVTVTESNEAPVLGAIGAKSVSELAALTFTATASDGDVIGGTADTLEFSLTGTPPSGASINSTSGEFSWTPTEQQDGTHTITVQVEDGNGGSDSEAVTVTVTESNEAPVLGAIGAKSVSELAALTFTATASDGDVIGGTADTLEFSLTGTPPSGASINSTSGEFSWTPTEQQDGTHTITVQVEDGNGGSDSEAVTVTVTESNEAPVLGAIGAKSVSELAALTFTATASDGDVIGGTADTLEFSLTGTPPSGASINSTSGEFSWTPTEQQDGTHVITIQVEDGNGGSDSEAVTVTVTESNEAPVLGAIGAKSVNELAALTFTATASDGDVIGGTADTLEFSLTGTPPSGASINSTSGEFSWTPTEQQDGTHVITIQVEDGNGGSDSEAVTVTVTESNEAPVLGAIGAKSVSELAALTFTATASDGDVIGGTADTLEFSLTGTPPSGASINSTSGEFSWTPTEQQDGTHTITVQVEDGNGGSDSEAVTVTVSEVNQAPALNPIGPKSVNELAALTFTATASDGDVIGGTADTLEFSLTGTPPSGASINSTSGAFSWTPTEQQDGTHTITVQVEDGNGGSDSEAVTVTVTESNEAPVLGAIGAKSVSELAALTFTATASDGDVIGGTADTLEFSLTGTPPSGASINSTSGEFSWTPTEQQDGTHTITVQVEDGAGATDSEAVTVTVSEVNQAPALNPIGPRSVNKLEALTFTATASDGDVIGGTADALEFSLGAGAPTGASINSTTGAFSWTPTASQVGTHTVTVQVEDGAGATDSEAVTVTVSESNENPVLGSIGAKSVDELAALAFTATATDGDSDTLEFTLAGTPPSGASINSTSGEFSWTPTEQQDGTHTITVQVEDGNGGSDSEAVTVTVTESNEAPVLGAIGAKSVSELAALTFTATASDGDVIGGTADTLEFSLTGTPPSGASINSTSGAFSWTPTEQQDGTHTITVQVEDGAGATDSEAVTVTVTESNEAPVLGAIGAKSVDELAALSFTATATDGDSDTLEFTLAGTPPSGASINSTSGEFSWTPTEQQDGTHVITIQVEDGNGGSDSEAVTVTVTESNEAPVLGAIGAKSVSELAALTFTATASDGDVIGGTADTLEFSLTGTPPSGASINSTSGEFSWTPTEQQDGTHVITIQVEDGNGGSDSEAVTVTVTESNEAPVLGAIGAKSVSELAALTFTATASDGDVIGGTADTLEFSLTGTPPSGASINSTSGEFSWTPTEQQDGTHVITIQVEDGNGGSDSEAVTVTVTESNEAPVLGAIGAKSVSELAALTFTATASDGDVIGGTADTLEFSLTGTPPSGASINSTSGEFSWTPTEQQDGTHTITVQVEDGNGGSDSEAVTVTVTESNEAPVLGAIGAKSVSELAALTFTATASDGDVIGGTADTLEFSLTGTPPSGASINSTSGEFSWTPSESQDGTHTITVQVEDGAGATDSEAVTVTVSEVNQAPALNPIGPRSVNKLEALTFTATASDGDVIGGTADALEFSLGAGAPTGASINSTTGAFSWTPSESQDGTHTITVQVEDGAGATDSEAVTVTVTESNENPVLGSIGAKSVDELAALSFTATATDGDNDTLEFTLAGTPPSGASINSTSGAFSWTPSESQDGTHSITARVSDGNGGSDSETITVTVSEVNADPVLASVGPKSVDELESFTFTATASDGDVIGGTADTLEFSLGASAPTGASISSTTGAFSWTPSESQDGTHTITVQVEDGAGATDSEAVTVTVSEVNQAPALNPIGPRSVNKLEALTFTATASDGDVIGGTADTLEFSLGAGAPTGASINSTTGAFSWTPTASQVGTHTVTVQVEDGAGATDSEAVTVTVSESNENPVLGSIGAKSVDELAALAFTATATDGDNDTLEFTLAGTVPTGASITSAGAFSWTPSESQDGTHSITARVSDGNGGSDSETITVTVSEVNQAPALNPIGPKGVNRPGTLAFTATASDGDVIGGTADSLEFSLADTPPSGASITSAGAFSWTPTAGQIGTHTITIQVEDGSSATDSEAVTVRITADSVDPPTTRSGGGSSTRSQAPALDFSTLKSYGLTPIPQDIAQLLKAFDRDEPIPPVNATGLPDAPLVINGSAYMLGGIFNTLEPQALKSGEPTSIIFTVYSRADIVHFTVYMNLQGADPRQSASDTYIRFDRGTVSTADPNGFIAGANVTITQDPGAAYKYRIQVDVEFAKGMEQTSMIIGLRSARSAPTAVYVINAFEVLPPAAIQAEPDAPEPDMPAPEPDAPSDQEPPASPTAAFRVWAGFGPATIGDAELAAALGLDYPGVEIPPWMKTGLAPLVVNGYATIGEFATALEYVLGAIQDLGARDAAESQPADPDTAAPTVTSIERSDPAGESTPETTLVFGVTFSEGVTGVDASDFALSPDSTGAGSTANLTGSGSQYLVTVSATRDGTYNLDVVRDSGITDAAGNPLADAAPTGADHTYTVIADTTAPTVASIERSDPAEESTSETTLVFGVTFGEDVTGVDAGDFALSPGSGSGPGRFTHAKTPGLAIPDNAAAVSDMITVPGFGTVTSVSVSVDIAHPFIGDLTVELVAPDGTARTLHDRSGGNADGIEQTYAPDFGGTGIAGDWTLRASDGASGDAGTLDGWTLTINHDGAGGSVTGLAGSGSQYLVTVSAPQGGTYNLDVAQDNGIADAAGNPLADVVPTGADHTYTVIADTTAPTVASIERSDPIEESTYETTLVFGVTFSEGVTGVDADDFALSPGSGSGPGQFTHARTPGLAIPDNAAAASDMITVPGFGTVTSVSVSVDIAHPYIDDLTVDLVAPDGTARTLHDRSGGNADGIEQTYAPDFGGTGIAGDWTLRASDGASGDAGTLNGWTLTINHDGAGGSVTGLAGSGSQYLVTVSAPQGGTYNLDVIRDSGIMDAAGNPLADVVPTGADHTYTVIADTTAPTVASIERSDPIEESTYETTLVFGVTFGENVTGVDADDFALSPGSGSGPGRFTHARTPGLAIPDNAAAVSDAITVPGFGTATSVSVSVDIAHPFVGDLTVELVAPDGTARTLHDRSGGNADGIKRTYAPDFGGTGIAGDWTLRASDGASGDAGTLDGWTLTINHDGAGGSVTGLAGSGSQYLVTVSAPQGGTYNLDVVQDGGIMDAAGNPLSGTNPTGADHTYTVIADATAPTVASIERSDPAEESTPEQTLVFGVTFGEDVTGVDADDFALSPDSGSGPGQFTHARTPGLAIPDNAAAASDMITVPGFGTATSVTVSVDIAHPYIDDLTVELVAPDGTARTLHDRSGGNADGIEQTYAPDFGGTGIAGDWTLRASDGASGDAGTLNGWTLTIDHDGAGGSVTGLTGSGSWYLVTVSAPQGGTYNLDIIRDSGIADMAGNPLADAAPTGADHTYARTGT